MAGGPTTTLNPSALDLLRCQQTLEPLVPEDGGLRSAGADLLYPIRDGLVFMGYDAGRHELMQELMEEERAWQGALEHVEEDMDFIRKSAPAAVTLLNLVERIRPSPPGARALELGSGAGWVSWLLAEAGYDTWFCDFEANSLALGWAYAHPNLGPGKRIVADATLPPFADHSFDLVLCKEFVHHVQDKERLIAEANRVLKPGGTLVMMEPVRSVWTTVQERRHPDPHAGHVIVWPESYLRVLRNEGFAVVWQGPYYYGYREGRSRITSAIKGRANARIEQGRGRPRDPLVWLHMHLVGGGASFVAIAEKRREAERRPRPRIRVVSPEQLVLTDAQREAYRPFGDVPREVAPGLVRRARSS